VVSFSWGSSYSQTLKWVYGDQVVKCTNCDSKMDKVKFAGLQFDFCPNCKLMLYDMQREKRESEIALNEPTETE